jgi:hypothetical protein
MAYSPNDSINMERLANVRSISKATLSLITSSDWSFTIWHMILLMSASIARLSSLLRHLPIHDSAVSLTLISLLIKQIQFTAGSVHQCQPGYITQTKFAVGSQ